MLPNQQLNKIFHRFANQNLLKKLVIHMPLNHQRIILMLHLWKRNPLSILMLQKKMLQKEKKKGLSKKSKFKIKLQRKSSTFTNKLRI